MARDTQLFNALVYPSAWLTCVLGAAFGRPLLGPAVVAVLLAAHLYRVKRRRQEARLIMVVGIIGFAVDSVQGITGVFTFTGFPPDSLCPPWLTSIWLVLGSTLNHSLHWLQGRYLLLAGVGALAGPLGYGAAHYLGAVRLSESLSFSLITLALVWALLLPLLFALALNLGRFED